ncbi:DEAH (Asp-Glu-Ala-His) box polypeptide 34 [Phlyctochytrium planicorne]|nr:DEAH (Asp-Glu-Ala-His) box polypeptide 34 [Phlyctochytrium planicorne]
MHFNPDGTLREETPLEAAGSVALLAGKRLRNLPPPPKPSRDVLLAEARASINLPKGVRPPPQSSSSASSASPAVTPIPWSPLADRFMFGKDGEAEFRRGSGEYDEFKDFYVKYKGMRELKRKLEARESNARAAAGDEEEYRVSRYALVLFDEYMAKKKKQALEKITKDRANLPIKPFEERIVEGVRNNKVILIAADTGAGKSTQVPQYLLAGGFDKIACTQPRRIACYSLARRVSYESLNIYGSEVAYQVRFEGTKTQKTKILFLTEGLLLRQFAADPKLSSYNVIIIDEVHERHITGDFLLGVLKRVLLARDDIRLVLMSATINAELFSSYFNAPLIKIPGRLHPVRIEYMPAADEDRNLVDDGMYRERLEGKVKESIKAKTVKLKPEPYLKILERIDQLVPAHERGDLLIFMSGMNEITALADELKPYALYTKYTSSPLQQLTDRKAMDHLNASQCIVFDISPPGVRKCILSTNIAETSVTIDGIRFIIDSGAFLLKNFIIDYIVGKVKEMGYDTKTGMSQLSEYWISRSSAKQRTGRAGRTGPGECFRFYSEKEFERMNEFPIPEILRMPLEPTLLQIQAYGLGDPREFDLIEKPLDSNINHALLRLEELGALESIGTRPAKNLSAKATGTSDPTSLEEEIGLELTPLGRVLSILPVNVVLGKMLILGTISDVIDSTIIMAAALTVPCPFTRLPDSRSDIASNRQWLLSEIGDPFTYLNVFSEWLKVKASHQSTKNWCKRHGLEEQRLYEMVKLRTQFEEVLSEYMRESTGDSDVEDSDDGDENTSKTQFAKKRKRPGVDDDEDRVRSGTPFWKDPNYIKKREQKELLEKQKRIQSSSKRKILRIDEGTEDEDIDLDGRMFFK